MPVQSVTAARSVLRKIGANAHAAVGAPSFGAQVHLPLASSFQQDGGHALAGFLQAGAWRKFEYFRGIKGVAESDGCAGVGAGVGR